jgi:hypothetical protein
LNAIIKLNGEDVTASCLLAATRISYDSSRRITTASITVMGRTLNRISRYDYAHYGQDFYSIGIGELYLCTILDGRDGTTKLFEGQIFSLTLTQTDVIGAEVFYACDLNDYASWLDRSVCWGGYTLTLPASDAAIIQGLVGHFCTRIDSATDIATVVPTVQAYDWKGKTTRQVLDDMAALAGAEWNVDFNAVLHYRLASNAPVAPFALSTSHDDVTSFPVKVTSYKQDFNNPVNRCYVRGATDPASGVFIEASYSDPVSVGKYGEYAYSVVDDQITTSWDASLRAKSVVLRYAYPVESGNFTIWAKDGLQVGQQVNITEDALGISGWYIIRSLTMQWVSKSDVQYDAQFGASQPDLETLLRLIDQRTRWKSTTTPTANAAPGSITDANIKMPPGLSAAVIGSVNANTIVGQIQAGQIGSVSAGAIVGTLSAGQISSVSAETIQGVITAGQIGSVNAVSIQGVIVTSQLGNQIVDDLAKYAAALQPIPMMSSTPTGLPNDNNPPNSWFYYIPDGHFYKMNAAGTSWTQDDSVSGSMRFYHIGAISANQIIGLIVAAQIQSITAGQITGQISAGQIGSVNASSISGQLTASQISTVNASSIQGQVSASQITTINASQITGSIQSTQIGSINAATITIGLIGDSQIGSISGVKITQGTIGSDKFTGFSLDVGGGSNMPGRIRVFNGSGSVVAQMGYLGEVGTSSYGGWFQLFGAGGTSYSNASMFTNAAGSLFLRNADVSISASGFQIFTSPSTFDTTYSSLAVKVSGPGGDLSSFISRGFLIYNGGTLLGGIVRDPSNASNLQGIFYNSSHSLAILIDGYTGTIRAAGFQVGSNPGFNGQVPAGHAINVSGGLITGYV